MRLRLFSRAPSRPDVPEFPDFPERADLPGIAAGIASPCGEVVADSSSLNATARDTLTDLGAMVDRVRKQLSADYGRHLNCDDG
jgi:hypothetical protein